MVLVWLILIPLLGALLAWLGGRWSSVCAQGIALVAMLGSLALSLWLWRNGDYSLTGAGFTASLGVLPQWAFEFRADWIPSLGISFHLGLDGLSLLMVVLTNLLGVVAVCCGTRDAGTRPGLFYFNLLWNLGSVIGVFLALDMFLFFFCWEMMLVPMYFLIARWGQDAPGGRRREAAALKFAVYTQSSGLLLLLAILALVFFHQQATGVLSFDYHDLLNTPLRRDVAWLVMLGFWIAFAVKMPVVPFHTWLADAHCCAPAAGSVDLAGLLLKTGAYGLLRFGIPYFPEVAHELAPIAMWLGALGVVYGAVLAFAQTDLKRLIAYSGISHMGFVLIGLYAGTEQALQGVVVQMIAHGLSAAALFMLCGEIQARLQTRELGAMGGLWATMPALPPLLLFFALASLGLPGLGNFVGEFLILLGAFGVAPLITVVAALGLVLAAAYALILVQKVLHGAPHRVGTLAALDGRALGLLVVLGVLLLGLGLYPQPVIDLARPSVQAVQHLYAAGGAATEAAVTTDAALTTEAVITGAPQ